MRKMCATCAFIEDGLCYAVATTHILSELISIHPNALAIPSSEKALFVAIKKLPKGCDYHEDYILSRYNVCCSDYKKNHSAKFLTKLKCLFGFHDWEILHKEKRHIFASCLNCKEDTLDNYNPISRIYHKTIELPSYLRYLKGYIRNPGKKPHYIKLSK